MANDNVDFGNQLLGCPTLIPESSAADHLLIGYQNDGQVSKLLLHSDLLEQAITVLNNLAHDVEVDDCKLLNDVSDAFREVYQELF